MALVNRKKIINCGDYDVKMFNRDYIKRILSNIMKSGKMNVTKLDDS